MASVRFSRASGERTVSQINPAGGHPKREGLNLRSESSRLLSKGLKVWLDETSQADSVSSSVNRLYGGSGRKRYLVAKQREYREKAGAYLQPRRDVSPSERYDIRIILQAPDNRRYDAENRLKSILNVLEYARMIYDDAQVMKLLVEKCHPRRPHGCAHVQVCLVSDEYVDQPSSRI